MAKITRVLQKIFGSNGPTADFGRFGSFAAGSPTKTKDPADIQSLSQFLDGWQSAIVGANSPAIEDVNSLHFLAYRQLAYIFQAGIPEFEVVTEYHRGSLINDTTTETIYVSIKDTNTGNAITDPEWWIKLKDDRADEPHAVLSGAIRSTSNQQAYLDPAGPAGGASLNVLATAVPLVYKVNRATEVLNADVAVAGLTVEPGVTNTCLINDVGAAGGEGTRNWGEEFHYVPNSPHKTQVDIDTIGATITALNGKVRAFKNQTSGEYMLAEIDTTNNRLHKILRGYFTNESLVPINRKPLNNNEVLQLMSTGWLYLDTAGAVDVTYEEPIHSFTEPTPTSGQYWHDKGTKTIKKGNGASFDIVNSTSIGISVIDTVDCVAVRAEDFERDWVADRSLRIEKLSVTEFKVAHKHGTVNVNGEKIYFGNSRPIISIVNDLAPAADMYDATEQATRQYYVYAKDDGDFTFSDIAPYADRRKKSFYHPHNPWKVLAAGFNGSGSNLSHPVYWQMTDSGEIQVGSSEPENLNIGAITTAPTKGTIVRDNVRWDKSAGGYANIKVEFEQSAAGTAGSGSYLFKLPAGLSIDTAKTHVPVDEVGESAVGHGNVSNAADGTSAASRILTVHIYDETQLLLQQVTNATAARIFISSTNFDLGSAINIYTFTVRVPIAGWD